MKSSSTYKKTLALIGGGPAALFMFKRIVDAGRNDFHIHIFERNEVLGKGMPYSAEGANPEHVTNVSDNEIPELKTTMEEWVSKAPVEVLKKFNIDPQNFNENKVVPRLFFGEYLAAQFDLLLKTAKQKAIATTIHNQVEIADLIDDPDHEQVRVIAKDQEYVFDKVVIATGHEWPEKNEGKVNGYFDSPYPPSKLAQKINFPVAIRGSSLTAFDALSTLSRYNGQFIINEKGEVCYKLNEESKGLKLVMFSIDGLLPAIRIHLENPDLSRHTTITDEEIDSIREKNNGFVPLDYLFEKNFKKSIQEKDPVFYESIRDMSMEEFVEKMLNFREIIDPFTLFKAEYAEANQSIQRQQPVPWKELLSDLSYAVNYPAKYFSAEDMLRLKKILMPLISIVIAFIPQGSAQELIALQEAGILSIVAVDRDSYVIPGEKEGMVYKYRNEKGVAESVSFKMFIDCIGQLPLAIDDIPFKGLTHNFSISPAKLQFESPEEAKKLIAGGNNDVEMHPNGSYYLRLPGIMINDYFQVVDASGAFNNRIYVMAVPYIGGINPDYSGLDFCDTASKKILESLQNVEV